MNSIILLGLVISCGFILGECASLLRLPKVSGYITAGLLLNPSLVPFVPESFVQHTAIPTDIALSFITFAVGGALTGTRLKELGRSIILIMLFESQLTFLITAAGMAFAGWLFLSPQQDFLQSTLPLALLFGALAGPTDPSATLAVKHQYRAEGKISSSILGVAGLDDIAGLVNFTVASALAMALVSHQTPNAAGLTVNLLGIIAGSVLLGALFGSAINFGLHFVQRETEGAQIVIVSACLMLSFGVAKFAGLEELLSTMTAGIIVANFSRYSKEIFTLLERYTDELIFVFFFTVSAMHLDFSLLSGSLMTIGLFILLRFFGKMCGTMTGGTLSGKKVRDSFLISLGLIPQGGIVIGLALTLTSRGPLRSFSDTLLAVIIGATIFHEFVGPLLASLSLRLSGEATTGKDK